MQWVFSTDRFRVLKLFNSDVSLELWQGRPDAVWSILRENADMGAVVIAVWYCMGYMLHNFASIVYSV